MVGTTVGFPTNLVEALAPQSHHRILWKCPRYQLRTCSTHCRVTGSGHLLNGGLRASAGVLYLGYRGLPVMAQTSEYARFSPTGKMAREPHILYQVRPHHSWLERKGHPPEKK
jgi:hypothetical protein